MAHINRFGDYTVDMSRKVAPIDFARRIFKEAEQAVAAASQAQEQDFAGESVA